MIFSGTTEGRALSEMLSEENIPHFVSVASEYGSEVMEEGGSAEVLVGRLAPDEMEAVLKEHGFTEGDAIVDATHPYAAEVSANIKQAAASVGAFLLRIVRGSGLLSGTGASHYKSMEACAKALAASEGNILLTTGSAALHTYASIVSKDVLERTYVRVLPAAESLALCKEAGIESSHIIAMQGPFTEDLNRATYEQYAICHLVTKESGAAGGFYEKMKPAAGLGITCHVIDRPEKETGTDIYGAFETLLGKPYEGGGRRIVLAGCGCGSEGTMTEAVLTTIAAADAVFGAKRLLSGIRAHHTYPMYVADEIIGVLEKERRIRHAVVLFSGDSGFYSGAKKAFERFKEWDPKAEITILPGISSIAYLSARVGVSYEDAYLTSVHGPSDDTKIVRLCERVRYSKKTFVLVSGDEDIRRIGAKLEGICPSARMVIGADLSYEGERIETLYPREALDYHADGIICLLILHEDAGRRPLMPLLPDDAFIREKVPMTKACIRNESILALRLREGDTVYDIGGGTGSVAIQIAKSHPSLSVTTIEQKPEAAELIKKNAKELGADTLTVLTGRAEEVLYDLPKPDAVFIGGSGGALRGIMRALTAKGEGIRYVINAATLETIDEARQIVSEYVPEDCEVRQISVSDVHVAGGYHMMQAQNPVMIFSFTL